MRQTMIIIGVAVGLVMLFLFVILPLLTRTGSGEANLFEGKDTLPPQTPAFSAPVQATNSAQLKLDGYSEASLK